MYIVSTGLWHLFGVLALHKVVLFDYEWTKVSRVFAYIEYIFIPSVHSVCKQTNDCVFVNRENGEKKKKKFTPFFSSTCSMFSVYVQ